MKWNPSIKSEPLKLNSDALRAYTHFSPIFSLSSLSKILHVLSGFPINCCAFLQKRQIPNNLRKSSLLTTMVAFSTPVGRNTVDILYNLSV